MDNAKLATMMQQVQGLLAEQVLSLEVELALELLLNAIEALSAEKQSLSEKVSRLRSQLDQKKREKNTNMNHNGPPKPPARYPPCKKTMRFSSNKSPNVSWRYR